MRHNKKKGMKLGTDASHTKAIKKSLLRALFINDRIKTLESRAKAVRGEVDRVITWAKKGDLASRRLAIAKVGDANLVSELFAKAAQGMWQDRNGGYTRLLKLGPRRGDAAEVVILEIVTEPVAPKTAAKTSVRSVKKVEKTEEPKVEETAEEVVTPAEETATQTDQVEEVAEVEETKTEEPAAEEAEADEASAETAPEAEAESEADKSEVEGE